MMRFEKRRQADCLWLSALVSVAMSCSEAPPQYEQFAGASDGIEDGLEAGKQSAQSTVAPNVTCALSYNVISSLLVGDDVPIEIGLSGPVDSYQIDGFADVYPASQKAFLLPLEAEAVTIAVTVTGTQKQTGQCALEVKAKGPIRPKCSVSADLVHLMNGAKAILTVDIQGEVDTYFFDDEPMPLDARTIEVSEPGIYRAMVAGPDGADLCAIAINHANLTNADGLSLAPPSCTVSVTPAEVLPGEKADVMVAYAGNFTTLIIDGKEFARARDKGELKLSYEESASRLIGVELAGGELPGFCVGELEILPIVNAPTCTLIASATSIVRGESVDIELGVGGSVKSAILDGHPLDLNSPLKDQSLAVSPAETRKYEAAVKGPLGEFKCSVTINVRDPVAPTCVLKATPSRVNYGDSVSLQLIADGVVTAASVLGTNVDFPIGLHQYTPQLAETVVGKVVGPGGEATCTARVDVDFEKPWCFLSATPEALVRGQSATLSMTEVRGVITSATIAGNELLGTDRKKIGSLVVAPVETTPYEGVVKGPGGEFRCSRTVSVKPPEPTCELSGPKYAVPTSLVDLRLKVAGEITEVTLDGSAIAVEAGKETVKQFTMPDASTERRLVVSGPGGSKTCTHTVTKVLPVKPSCTLSAAPTTVEQGKSVTLTVASDSLYIDAVQIGTLDDLDSLDTLPAGAMTHTLTNLQTSTIYRAIVRDKFQQTGSCQLSVDVIVPAKPPRCILTPFPETVSEGGAAFVDLSIVEGEALQTVLFRRAVGSEVWGDLPRDASGKYSLTNVRVPTEVKAVAIGEAGAGECLSTINVSYAQPACSLTATPSVVSPGSATTLTLTTTSGTTTDAFIDQDGTSSLRVGETGGSVSVANISATRAFTAYVTGPGGQGQCYANVRVDDTQKQVLLLTMSASQIEVAKGGTRQIQVSALYEVGGQSEDVTGFVTWKIEPAGVVTIDGNGLLTGLDVGAVVITGTYANKSVEAVASVTAVQANLKSLSISPRLQTINAGALLQFSLTGLYEDGAVKDLTKAAVWRTSDETIAKFSGTAATGLKSGTVNVIATYNGVSQTTPLTVLGEDAQVVRIWPRPSSVLTVDFDCEGNTLSSLSWQILAEYANGTLGFLSNENDLNITSSHASVRVRRPTSGSADFSFSTIYWDPNALTTTLGFEIRGVSTAIEVRKEKVCTTQ